MLKNETHGIGVVSTPQTQPPPPPSHPQPVLAPPQPSQNGTDHNQNQNAGGSEVIGGHETQQQQQQQEQPQHTLMASSANTPNPTIPSTTAASNTTSGAGVTSNNTIDGTTGTTTSGAGGASTKTGTQAVFIHKLYNMLEDESLDHLIWWGENSDDSFMLIPNTEFSKALSVYFKHSNIASFVRQLNMYGFHKVNDSQETQGGVASNKEEIIPTWEFKHNSGYFKKGDLDSLKNIKRRSSKNNISRELGTKQLNKIQNYMPKSYEEEDLNFENTSEILTRLNELNYNFSMIKNEHMNLSKKYDLALEDLKKANYDLVYLLDLIKDLASTANNDTAHNNINNAANANANANSNKDFDALVSKFKANIMNRISLREHDLSNLSMYHAATTATATPAMSQTQTGGGATSLPYSNQFSRLNSVDSVSREPTFINKDIRFSSISSSSKRHHSILYDPLTTDPFPSRNNSQTELSSRPLQSTMFTPLSPGQPPPTSQMQMQVQAHQNYQQQQQQQHQQLHHQQQTLLPPPPPPPPQQSSSQAQQQQHPSGPPSAHPAAPQQHYFQDHHSYQTSEHHRNNSTSGSIGTNPIRRNDSVTSMTSVGGPFTSAVQHITHPLPPHQQLSNSSIATYSSTQGSSSAVPQLSTRYHAINTPDGGSAMDTTPGGGATPTGGVGGLAPPHIPSHHHHPHQQQQQQHAQHATAAATAPASSSSNLPKLQSPFESESTTTGGTAAGHLTNLRRERSDSVSDRVIFKRTKS